MITYQKFNINDLTESDTFVLLHGVNRERKMGKGIALDIRNKWPTVYEQYTAADPVPVLGSTQFVVLQDEPLQIVVNCFSQNKYRRPKDPSYMVYACPAAIEVALRDVFRLAQKGSIPSHVPILMPRIGCSLGGLTWDAVGPIVERLHDEYLQQHSLFVIDK